MSKWQPLETIPENEYVILHSPSRRDCEGNTPYAIGYRSRAVFYTEDAEICYPTHWMPLPEAPDE